VLQVWYIGVVVFGFLRWSQEGTMRVSLLSWRGHAAGVAASLLLAVIIAVPENTPIKAAAGGVVVFASDELKSYGNSRARPTRQRLCHRLCARQGTSGEGRR
jgi:hypothetical protein